MRFFLCLALVMIWAGPVLADMPLYERTYTLEDTTRDPLYEVAIEDAIGGPYVQYSFGNIRNYYSLSSYYEPYSQSLTNKMQAMAYFVETSDDPESINVVLESYGKLLKDHLGHMGVVLQALALSREDKRFGDQKFLQWVRDGLLQDVLYSGTGDSLSAAYDVIVPEEETMLLLSQGGALEQIKSGRRGVYYFNRYVLRDPDTGRLSELYVDISRPMERMHVRMRPRGIF